MANKRVQAALDRPDFLDDDHTVFRAGRFQEPGNPDEKKKRNSSKGAEDDIYTRTKKGNVCRCNG
jgi:hypothetical protein